MGVLVLTAMAIEKEMLLSSMTNVKILELINGSQLHTGILDGCDVSLIEAGIGKVNAAMSCALSVQSMQKKPRLIINSGVAGAIDPKLNTCDIVISSCVSYYDVNVCAFGYVVGQVPDQPPVYESDHRAVQMAVNICEKNHYPAYIGQIVSGDRFVSDIDQVERIRKDFPNAMALEMEGAAVGHVASRCRIPFLVIRGISDATDSDAKCTYERFLVRASERSESVVRGLVNAEKDS